MAIAAPLYHVHHPFCSGRLSVKRSSEICGIVARWRSSTTLIAALGTLWLLSAGAGLAGLLNYANSPGAAATPPSHWPEDSRIERSPSRPTLVTFVHPHCPCSRASLEELDRVMARV